jgi:hypothetical protein
MAHEDQGLKPEQLDDKYNQDGYGEHPLITREAWRHEVFDSNTLLGYWEWVANELEHNLDAWEEEGDDD